MCLKPTIQRSATEVVLKLVNQAVFQASGFSQGLIDSNSVKIVSNLCHCRRKDKGIDAIARVGSAACDIFLVTKKTHG